MLISTWVHQFQEQLRGIAQLGDPATQRTTEHLITTSTPLLRSALTEALAELVAECNETADRSVHLAMEGDNVSLGFAPDEVVSEQTTSGEKSARIALRLTEELKLAIEQAAAQSGQSTNTWIVNTLHAKTTSRSNRPGNRLRGTGRA